MKQFGKHPLVIGKYSIKRHNIIITILLHLENRQNLPRHRRSNPSVVTFLTHLSAMTQNIYHMLEKIDKMKF